MGVKKNKACRINGIRYLKSRYLTFRADNKDPAPVVPDIINTTARGQAYKTLQCTATLKNNNSTRYTPSAIRKSKSALMIAEKGMINLGKYIFFRICALLT